MSETFDRIEKKYLLSAEQYNEILKALMPYVDEDAFFKSQVMSIYYDTPNYQLIRRSVEKPDYKEKLRIRSYSPPKKDDEIFVELKKKLDGVVYKRRTTGKYGDVLDNIYEAEFKDVQVGRELKYFLKEYENLRPMIFIGTDRYSYRGKENKSLRITFDLNMRYRLENLSLKDDPKNRPINDGVIMEIKADGAYPLWLSNILSDNKAYPRGFSKVGTAYLKSLGGK